MPAGSTLVVRATGQVRLDVVTTGGLAEPKTDSKAADAAKGTEERRYVINDAGHGDAAQRRRERPDTGSSPPFPTSRRRSRSPRIRKRRRAAPCSSPTSSRTTTASSARRRRSSCKKTDGTNGEPPRPLYEAPDFALVLPQARTKTGVGTTTKDLTEHPWAGADVTMTLTARDEAGNEGTSEPFELRLPERPFTKPVARAL